MSSILKNAAVTALTRYQPSTFYDRENRPNPLLQALNQELKLFFSFMKRRSSPGYTKPAEEPYARPASTLFELWNKYQPRLPHQYYEEKLMEVGDFLVSIKEYKLAFWQCYERYLQSYGDINVDNTFDAAAFQANFYSDENAVLMSRALLGKSICMYHIVTQDDPKLQNKPSVERCIKILSFLQLVTQVVLPKEALCWLVYNGTIHIYSISRHLMSLGYSSRALEYLLWASMCMETSVPLLTAKYLSWRATLYTAVCQCYYDCRAGENAENFGRRGLMKIYELSSLESVNSNRDMAVYQDSFRSATVRMAVMVFKRSVFETRKKPKGFLRPKTRANLKEVLNLPWPRTPTESMLADMFDCGSGQFLAVLESLSNSNRRILQTSPPAPDSEPEILDVFCELMMAAQEIMAGGGGNHDTAPLKSQMSTGASPMTNVVIQGSLIQMATKGEDNVPLESVIRLMKLAYAYEHWDIFEVLQTPVLALIKESNDEKYRWDEKALELLSAMRKVNSNLLQKKQPSNIEAEEVEKTANEAQAGKKSKMKPKTSDKPVEKPNEPAVTVKSNFGDDLIQVADVLMSIATGSFEQNKSEIDLVVDATLLLWNKCKPVFQKYQTGSVNNPRFLQKMENPNKDEEETIQFTIRTSTSAWIYLLETIHQSVGWCGISSVDPVLAAEVVLRLALVYESSAKLDSVDLTKISQRESRATCNDSESEIRGNNPSSNLVSQLSLGTQVSAKDNILRARQILRLGLTHISYACQATAMNDGKSIADVTWVKELFASEPTKEKTDEKISEGNGTNPDSLLPDTATTVKSTVKDLHLELLLTYHRICLKLCAFDSDTTNVSGKRKFVSRSKKENPAAKFAEYYVQDFKELCDQCNKNYLSKALLLAQRAVALGTEQGPTTEQRKLLEDAVNLVQRVQIEEKKIFSDNTADNEMNIQGRIPPPPILLCRTDTYMMFRPAPFEPESGEKVAWYCIFAKCASGPSVKVRLNDNCFPGTGEEVPSLHCEFKVANLEPNERYVFAVAAYTANRTLIGDHIGETTRPFLAFHPLPVLTTWAFISQMAYQVGHYSVASQACNVLWDHFVIKPQASSSATYITETKKDFRVSLLRLNQRVVYLSSPNLLRQFLTTIFINTDIAVKDGQLFCDIVCDKGIVYGLQIQRLKQCERILVAVELAGWLNEASLALQAVVQMYGLLAPMLYQKIQSLSIVQILQRCHAVLHQIPPDLIKKRQGSISDSLNHMVACITYHLAKALRSCGQKDFANTIIESSRCLLAYNSNIKFMENKMDALEQNEIAGWCAGLTVVECLRLAIRKLKKPFQPSKNIANTRKLEKSVNEELMALEAHMNSVNESAVQEQELRGNEDPNILHAYISCMPASQAFKEVEKFKSKQRYLEFLVQVSQKGLMEGLADQVIQWCNEGFTFLTKRNENIIGSMHFINKQPGAVVVSGNDPKKFAAAMVEYKKDAKGGKSEKSPLTKNIEKKKAKYKPLRVTASMSETTARRQEEAELKALDTLLVYFVDKYKAGVRRRDLRTTTVLELPWRSQMNIIQGLSNFNILLQKLEKRDTLFGISVNRTNYLDQEWFTLETAGVMITDWNGGPSSYQSTLDTIKNPVRDHDQTNVSQRQEKEAPTLIQLAAAAVAGYSYTPSAINTQVLEPPDTPPTYRSDKVPAQAANKNLEDSLTLSAGVAIQALRNTFAHFKKAMVLAHRGQNWALLQNACRVLWNCTHTVMLRMCTANQTGGDRGMLTTDALWSLLWHPFNVACDCLLDMMTVLQDSLEKSIKNKGKGQVYADNFDSWMGTIKSDRGGASLKFDTLLDDVSIVDTRWVRRMTLRTLELLYSQQKYEKLVDIALRFSALTNNRYAEQVIPLIVQAQRLLEKRIKQAGGPAPPQPHFKILQAQLGHVIYAKDYLNSQLHVQIDKEAMVAMELGAQIDPIGHGAYSQIDGLHLSAVPLDTTVSLRELRGTLDQAHFTARALQHSRKLLCLYLAGQQNLKEGLMYQEVSHVDFKMATEQPHPTMPSNKLISEFHTANEIQFPPLPQSQLGTVISSYEKSIEMLCAKNQKGISAQAMHELGNIFFHAKNIKAAFHWWCQSLDLVLNTSDAIHTWRNSLQNGADESAMFLDRCGLWGCVLAGVLASNIAQYIVTEDNGLRIECCLLSGFLFKALFRSSLPHPTADRDYALYDIGEGCEVINLVPGIDFLSDRFRCDGRQLVGALKWVTEELSRTHYHLFVLPLLTLSQYFTTCVCRDVQQAVEGRILRIQILTDLGLFTEAITALQYLLNGERLPQAGDNSFRVKEDKSSVAFSTFKLPAFPVNLKVIESFMNKRLSLNLRTLFGPHLTCRLALVQAHLLIALANTIPLLPKINDQTRTDKDVQGIKGAAITRHQSLMSKTPVLSKYQGAEFDVELDSHAILTLESRVLGLEDIKSMILAAAEMTVTVMIKTILEKLHEEKQGPEALSAAELELVVQCQLEQTFIAQQKHHAPMAAHTVLSALKMLQNSWIFKNKRQQSSQLRPSSMKSGSANIADKTPDQKCAEPEQSHYQYQNLQARLRLNARLWLKCRLELVKSLMMEVRGMGEIKGSEIKVVSDLADCRKYCAEGLGEAEVCVDLEMQAQFLYLGAQLNIIEGKSLEHTSSLLEDAIRHLHHMSQCSDSGEQLLTSCIMFKTDLEAVSKSHKHSDTLMHKTLKTYLEVQGIILERMEQLGEKIVHYKSDGQMEHLASPTSPLQNIYLPQVQMLAEVKLRIGHAIARNCSKMVRNGSQTGEPLLTWADSLGVLTTALEISQVSALRDASLESEILLMMGKVQKMMVYLGKYEARAAAGTFLKAIKISHINGHDLGLIRQAYLEIALIYMHSAGLRNNSEGSHTDPITQSNKQISEQTITTDHENQKVENDKERIAIWLAIKCAAAVAYAQQSRSVVIGNTSVISEKIQAISSLPDFLPLDLLSRNILGKKQKIYKNEIEEELALLIESQEVNVSETYDSQVNKIKIAATDLSWIHLLGYQTILQRLVNTATLSTLNQQTDGSSEKERDCDLANMNHNVVRYMLHSGGWSTRLAIMHKYLFNNLRVYANGCCAPYPPEDFALPRLPQLFIDPKIIVTYYFSNTVLSIDADSLPSSHGLPASAKVTLPPSSNLDTFKSADQISSLEDGPELSVQWYNPDLEDDGSHQSGSGTLAKQVTLLYAFASEESEPILGSRLVALQKVYELHDRLVILAQKTDIFIIAKNELLKIKPTESKLQHDVQLEILFKQCLDDAWVLMKGTHHKIAGTDPEFNIINIKNLESVFDPSLGLTLKGTELLPWLLKLFT